MNSFLKKMYQNFIGFDIIPNFSISKNIYNEEGLVFWTDEFIHGITRITSKDEYENQIKKCEELKKKYGYIINSLYPKMLLEITDAEKKQEILDIVSKKDLLGTEEFLFNLIDCLEENKVLKK